MDYPRRMILTTSLTPLNLGKSKEEKALNAPKQNNPKGDSHGSVKREQKKNFFLASLTKKHSPFSQENPPSYLSLLLFKTKEEKKTVLPFFLFGSPSQPTPSQFFNISFYSQREGAFTWILVGHKIKAH